MKKKKPTIKKPAKKPTKRTTPKKPNHPSKDSETLVQRNANGTLKSGSVLNPKGMQRGTRHLTTILIEALKNKKVVLKSGKDTINVSSEIALIDRLLDMALGGSEGMVKLIFGYLDGLPSQPVEVTKVVDLSDEEKGLIDNIRQQNS